MSQTNISTPASPALPGQYRIRVKGHLDQRWTSWFGNLTITLEEGGTTLETTEAVDQAGLFRLLRKVRDLGAPLLAVTCLSSDQTEAGSAPQQSTG